MAATLVKHNSSIRRFNPRRSSPFAPKAVQAAWTLSAIAAYGALVTCLAPDATGLALVDILVGFAR